MEDFIRKLESIIHLLNELEGKYSFTLSKEYDGNEFPEQNQLSVKMENLILAATHETATTLSFIQKDILLIKTYIQFRKKYKDATTEELEQIIDIPFPNLKMKKQLQTKTNNQEIIKNIREDWNANFSNESFQKIHKRLLSL